jgi:hypothetical protein
MIHLDSDDSRPQEATVVSTLKSFRFLFMGPLILLFLVVINLMTSPGHWWVQWAALGIGIAWVTSLFRVIRAVVVAGGLAALGAWLLNRNQNGGATGPRSSNW